MDRRRFIACVGAAGAATAWSAPVAASQDVARDVARLTNEYRAQNGLGALAANATLAAAAQNFADDYARIRGPRSAWGHEFGGTTLRERLDAVGYQGSCWGENLGFRATTGDLDAMGDLAQLLVDGWKSSPGHNQNLLAPNFGALGVGVGRYPLDGFNWIVGVQVFGCA